MYNHRLGVPVQESDPNGLVTYAEYDGFGRLTKLIRPGESSAALGVSVSYSDTGVNNLGPFLVEIEERHSGGAYNVRKFYNGLGQLLQVQTANAQVYGGAHDVAVDYAYNAYGQRTQETKPYLLAVWTPAAGGTPYRGQYFNQPKTVTSYDGFGRVSKVQSPTASEAVTVTYPADLQVRQCNGRNQCTLTLYDAWGRVVEVRPTVSAAAGEAAGAAAAVPAEDPKPAPAPATADAAASGAAAERPGAGAPEAPSPAAAAPAERPIPAAAPPSPAPSVAPPVTSLPPLTYAQVIALAIEAGWPAELADSVARVAWCESRFRPDAVGYMAYGLMQVIPLWFEYAGIPFER